MAGEGKRFKDVGYTIAKPLLDTDGIPMFVRAARSLPLADLYIFVCRRDQVDQAVISSVIQSNFPASEIIYVDELTKGQAITCLMAQSLIPENCILNIGPSDSDMIFDPSKYDEFIRNPHQQALIWTITGDQSVLRNVNMYGWVLADRATGAVRNVSCKQPVSSNPSLDPAIIGCFSFKPSRLFFESVNRMVEKNDTINQEYYVDVAMNHLIALGGSAHVLNVEQYICWGTPADYESYLHWLKYFKHAT